MAERSTAATKMNHCSSRSHAIFQIKLVMNNDLTGVHRCATINLVDLAGSESIKRSGATGERFEEASSINQSLATLRLVFDKLIESQAQSKRGHGLGFVPYRDSILTRVLQDSLGGNSRTIMIANVSPHPLNIAETRNTLTYAVKAQAITCNVRRNEERNTTLVHSLRAQAEQLRAEMEGLRSQEYISVEARDKIRAELEEEMLQREQAWEEQRRLMVQQARDDYEQELRQQQQELDKSRKGKVLGLWQKGALACRVDNMQKQVLKLETQLREERENSARLQGKLDAERQSAEQDVAGQAREVVALRRLLGEAVHDAQRGGRRHLGDETARLAAEVVTSAIGTRDPQYIDPCEEALDNLSRHKRDKEDGTERPSLLGDANSLLPCDLANITEETRSGEVWAVFSGDPIAQSRVLSQCRQVGGVTYVKLPSREARDAIIPAAGGALGNGYDGRRTGDGSYERQGSGGRPLRGY